MVISARVDRVHEQAAAWDQRGDAERWRKQTRGEASSALAGSARPHADAPRSVFTPAQVVRRARAEGSLVEVVTRSGCVVRMHGAVDEDTLTSVFAAVGGC